MNFFSVHGCVPSFILGLHVLLLHYCSYSLACKEDCITDSTVLLQHYLERQHTVRIHNEHFRNIYLVLIVFAL